ncbi:N-6 DNA methylase [Deinococcus frigens]|uniref:N-6 DNA methylase n=1 Tax=Deinococcus frigens TaxID=249403 RepID=UPI0004956251|nr:N-6 DNA methylase [Deinococcus frigens]
MTNPPPTPGKMSVLDLFGTYREPVKVGKKSKKVAQTVKPADDVKTAPVTNADLLAFALRSAPRSAPGASGPAMGIEALDTAGDAARISANTLARTIAHSEGKLTDKARDALRAWSGEGGLGGSTSAFYTPGAVAQFAWNVVTALTPVQRALEFACGGGVFFNHAPRGTLLTGVEIDETTARIAQALFPHVSVHHAPFETYHTQSEDAPFDVVIGNPPFGTRGTSAYLDRPALQAAHWYFVLAGLERAAPGGYMAVIVPESMLRNPSERGLREAVLDVAHVLTASAVPETAFRDSGARVTTALLVLRRHDAGVAEALGALTPDERATIRQARVSDDGLLARFVDGMALFHQDGQGVWNLTYGFPHLGTHAGDQVRAGRFGDPVYQTALCLDEDALTRVSACCLDRRHHILTRPGILSAVRTLLGVEAEDRAKAAGLSAHPIREGQRSRCGTYRFRKGRWGHDGPLNDPATLSALNVARAVTRVRTAQERRSGSAEALRVQAAAQHAAHLKQYGAYDLRALDRAARTLPILNVLSQGGGDVPGLLAELHSTELVLTGGTVQEVAQQLEAYGMLDAGALGAHARVSLATAHAHLRAEYAFTGRIWEAGSTYFAGNAHARAGLAETLADEHTGPERAALLSQAARLRTLAPWKDLADMTLEARDPLVPESVLTEWVNTYLDAWGLIKRNTWDKGGERVGLLHASREEFGVTLRLRNTLQGAQNLEDRQSVAPGRVRALEAYLNFSTPVEPVVGQDVKSAEQIAAERGAKQAAAARWEKELAAHFRSFVLEGQHAGVVERTLNEGRYGLIPRQSDTRALVLPAYQGPLAHPFQAGHVRTAARMDGAILNFAVGLGKTLTGLMLAALLLQSGRARTVAIVVPLSRLADWVMNASQALPSLNILVVGGDVEQAPDGSFALDDNGEPLVRTDDARSRGRKIAGMLAGAPDIVLLTLEAFEAVPMLEETRLRMIERDATLMAGAGTATTFDERARKLGGHRLLSAQERVKQRQLARVRVAADNDVPWEVLGIGAILTDEVHALKNSYAAPTVYGESNPKFLGAGGESNRAIDAVHKYRFVRQQGGCTVGLTATWFTNSPLEIFNQMMLHTDALASYGIPDVSAFTARFCVIESRLITLPGGDVEFRPCVVGFRNLDELRAIMAQHVIRETEDSCLMHEGVGMKLPPLHTVEHLFDLPEAVMERYEAERATLDEVESEGKLHLFSIFSRMMKLTLHPPLLGLNAPNVRFAECVRACVAARETGGRNVVFMYMGGADGAAYRALKDMLIAAGYPEREVEMITASTHKTAGERLGVERRFRRGELTCVIGSSVIEQGGNFQGCTDLHHLDYPHHFEAFRQRTGRARRQGTWVTGINNHLYFARDSFDALRYQNMLGKKGWAEQVYDPSVVSCENSDAGFDGEELAIMLSRDPALMRATILRKKEARAQETRSATVLADASVIREYLDTLGLLRSRDATARGREKGPTPHDVAGISRLITALRALHRQVGALRSAAHPLCAVTRLTARPVWVAGLPMHPGMSFSSGGKAYQVVSARASDTEIKVREGAGGTYGSLAVAGLEPVDVLPTTDETAFGEETFVRLPRRLRERIEGGEEGALMLAVTVPPVMEGAPLMGAVPAAAAGPVSVVESAPGVGTAPTPVAPLSNLVLRYGLSVLAAPRPGSAVFSVVGDRLEPGERPCAALFQFERRADQGVRMVTLIIADDTRREYTRRMMLTHDPRLRARVDGLLATAI